MKNRSRTGGVVAGLLLFIVIGILAAVAGAVFVASNLRVHHEGTRTGDHVRVETPFGNVNIDARDDLKPESVGVPVYPGAMREHRNNGGVLVDFDGKQQLSVSAAEYSTSDSAEQVREFYRSRLPHWIFTQKFGRLHKMEFSEGGYKRIIAINEKGSRTYIGIASVGEPGIN